MFVSVYIKFSIYNEIFFNFSVLSSAGRMLIVFLMIGLCLTFYICSLVILLLQFVFVFEMVMIVVCVIGTFGPIWRVNVDAEFFLMKCAEIAFSIRH